MINSTEQKIIGFAQLATGWNFGEGIPASDQTTEYALILNRLLSSFARKTDAFPGVNGEIEVTAYNGSLYLEFIIETDQSVTFTYEIDDKVIGYEEDLSIDQVLQKIVDFRELSWALSGSLIKTATTTAKRNVFKVSPSSLPKIVAQSLLLTGSVVSDPVRVFATISEDITKKNQVLPQYSGRYPSTSSQANADLYQIAVKTEMSAIITS